MSVGIQRPDVINALDRLKPSDVNLDNPTFDPSNLVVVYPIDSTYIGLNYIALSGSTASINGASHTMYDTSATGWNNSVPASTQFDISMQRMLTWRVTLAGGAYGS